jgi:hypothetical protein
VGPAAVLFLQNIQPHRLRLRTPNAAVDGLVDDQSTQTILALEGLEHVRHCPSGRKTTTPAESLEIHNGGRPTLVLQHTHDQRPNFSDTFKTESAVKTPGP